MGISTTHVYNARPYLSLKILGKRSLRYTRQNMVGLSYNITVTTLSERFPVPGPTVSRPYMYSRISAPTAVLQTRKSKHREVTCLKSQGDRDRIKTQNCLPFQSSRSPKRSASARAPNSAPRPRCPPDKTQEPAFTATLTVIILVPYLFWDLTHCWPDARVNAL